jgi:hypothetical protein
LQLSFESPKTQLLVRGLLLQHCHAVAGQQRQQLCQQLGSGRYGKALRLLPLL